MKRPLLTGALIVLIVMAVLAGAPLWTGPSHSQKVRTPPPPPRITPVPPVVVAPTVVTITPVPTTPVPRAPITTAPRIEAAPRVLSTPADMITRTIVPGAGPRQEAESPDCSVHQFTCAESCDPLPAGWTSYGDCVRYRCKQVEENCIEKLIQELQSREGSNEVTFYIKSDYHLEIQLEFYSQDRDVAWPGSRRYYEIKDNQTHVYKLSCKSGEDISYGAWTSGLTQQWGVGKNNRLGCVGCTAKCDGQSVSRVLVGP